MHTTLHGWGKMAEKGTGENAMKRPLGLHQSSAMDISPAGLIKAASTANYDHVGLFTNNLSVPIDGKGLHRWAAYFDEVHDRELPGDGDFPLHDILCALPNDAPIEVKIPRDSRIKAGGSAQDYVERAYERTRALLDSLE